MKVLIGIFCLLLLVCCDNPEVRMVNYDGMIYKKDAERALHYEDTIYYLYVTAFKTGKTYKVQVLKETYDSTAEQKNFHITERVGE